MKQVKSPQSPTWRQHWDACDQIGELYDSLNAIYDASEWPPVGQEGAFPFAFIERVAAVEPAMAELYTAIWNDFIPVNNELQAGKPVGVRYLELERRLCKAHTVMLARLTA